MKGVTHNVLMSLISLTLSMFGTLILTLNFYYCYYLIGIYFIQDWTAIIRHGVTRKRSTRRKAHTGFSPQITGKVLNWVETN